MANILMVTTRLPWPLDDGYALRVFELARHLGPEHNCHLACEPQRTTELAKLEELDVFRTITVLPRRPVKRHWRRMFRRGDHDFIRAAYPGHYRQIVTTLQQVVDRERIDVAVAVLLRCEEYVRPLQRVARVTDEYDCATLALERELAVQPPANLVARWRARQQLAHLAARESRLGKTCRLVTTIAEPDAARLRRLNPPGTRIEVVPNGVDARLLELPRPEADGPAAVSFWGNLGFPVNQRAVQYFYSQIWRPHLQPRGVRWAIVGPNADAAIADLAARHEEIVVPGFVDDLFAFLRRYPIMVNPMISGAGLKNKVLEAFAAGLAVVSTSMGVEALRVRDGVHCRIVDDPTAFGEAVRELIDQPAQRRELAANAEALVRSDYSWPAVSGHFARILL